MGQIVKHDAAASNLMALGVPVQDVQGAKRTQQLRGAVALRSAGIEDYTWYTTVK